MRKRHKKQSKKIKIRFYFLCFIAFLGGGTLIFSDFGLKELLKLKKQKEQLNYKIQNLYQQQIALQEEINQLSYDTNYVEKIAREKFLMVKPGEKVFRVIESKRDQ
tara:strand:+ start:2375 stop:2692 length:318 start_codon:yes stop_codon:yes gene_type:complete